MKTKTIVPSLIKTIVAVLTVQLIGLATVQARPGGRHVSKVPTSVIRLDSASHDLADSFARSIKGGPRHMSRSQVRFLNAAKSFETSAHNLRSTIENDRGYRRAKEDLNRVRSAYNILVSAAQDVRLSDRVRVHYQTARSVMRDIERDREVIYASASPNTRGHGHGRPGPGGVLGKIFGRK